MQFCKRRNNLKIGKMVVNLNKRLILDQIVVYRKHPHSNNFIEHHPQMIKILIKTKKIHMQI